MWGFVFLGVAVGLGYMGIPLYLSERKNRKQNQGILNMNQVLLDVLNIHEEKKEWKKIDDHMFLCESQDCEFYIYKQENNEDVFVDVRYKDALLLTLKSDEQYKVKILADHNNTKFNMNKWIIDNFFQFRGWSIHTQYRYIKEMEKQKFILYKANVPKTNIEGQKELYTRLQLALYHCTVNPVITRESKRELAIQYADFTFKIMVTPTNHTMVLCLNKGAVLFHYAVSENKIHYTEENLPYLQAIERNTNLRIDIYEWTMKMKALWKETKGRLDIKDMVIGEAKEVNGLPIFNEEFSKMNELKQHVAHLTTEEFHLITVTYPNDLYELEQLYQALQHDDKQSLKPKIKEMKQQVQEKLTDIEKEVNKRKCLEVEQKIRVVQTRD